MFPRTLSKTRDYSAKILRPSGTQLRKAHILQHGSALPRYISQNVSQSPRHVGVHYIRRLLPRISHDSFRRRFQRVRVPRRLALGDRLQAVGSFICVVELARSRPGHGRVCPRGARQQESTQHRERNRKARHVVSLSAELK